MKKFRQSPTALNWRLRAEAIRIVNYTKKALQREHIDNALKTNKGNSKETWKTLKKWPLRSKSVYINNINGNSDPVEMANLLNTHFASIG